MKEDFWSVANEAFNEADRAAFNCWRENLSSKLIRLEKSAFWSEEMAVHKYAQELNKEVCNIPFMHDDAGTYKPERLSVSSNGLSKSYITIRRNPRKGEIVLVVPTSDSDGACLAQVWRVNKRTKSLVVRLLSYEDRLGMCSSNIEIGYGWCTPANYLHHKDLEQK